MPQRSTRTSTGRMAKLERRGGSLTASNRIPLDHELSYNTADVPPELWTIVASFASRQSLGRLCSVSHRFYSLFSALLYANTVDPPLTCPQSWRLINTLSNKKSESSKPHPATLIRHLGLKERAGTQHPEQKTKNLIKAFKNLELSSRRSAGSALRTLHWSLATGVDELGKILGKFRHLKELVVSTC
ncbi:hypothetical protein B0H13DRAFT_2473257 [Mycena leptocephala]|nr:hypothetical protein B0H13DRAFT_2473257 [Mycena leptocephala]